MFPFTLWLKLSQHGHFSVMAKCWYQNIWLALLVQWLRHQNTNLQIPIWIKRDLYLLLLHKYIKNIYHTHTKISYLFLKITSLRLFGKKCSQNCGRTLMFLCLCLIADHGFKVSPRKSPESPSSERSLVFSVTAPSPQSSPSSGRLTPTNLGAGAINYSSHSINLSPYSSPGVSKSSCLMTQL